MRGGSLRYWSLDTEAGEEPVLTEAVWKLETDWKADEAYRVIADFPERFFARHVACRVDAWGKGDTTKVMIWVR